MAEKMDMSLDDIISSNKGKGGGFGGGRGGSRGGGRGGSRGGGRGNRRGSGGPNRMDRSRSRSQGRSYSRGNPDGQWDHDMFSNGGGGRPAMGGGGMTTGGPGKLLVSNLDFGVSESDIHELFSEFGTLKLATVHYDRSGRSLGTAEVVFDRRSDAVKALKQYNGVPLDGRPMRIEIAGGERDMAASAPLRRVSGGAVGRRGDAPRPRGMSSGGRGGPRGGRGGGRGGGGGGAGKPKREEKPVKSKEDLDAEMDAYMNSKA